MLTAIDFDDKPSLGADEVGNEPTHWHLPAELDLVESAAAQLLPQTTLRFRRLAAHPTSEIRFDWSDRLMRH